MHELTHITHLIAEAFGEPGDRTFRISAKTDSHLIYIWVEKEHLIQLSLLVFQLSEKVSSKQLILQMSTSKITKLTFQ